MEKSMLYIMNSPILTGYGEWSFEGPMSVDKVKNLLNAEPFTSAIGHESTAQFLSQLLECPIEANRIRAELQPTDRALVLRLNERLPEGVVLTAEQVQTMPFELGLLVRLT